MRISNQLHKADRLEAKCKAHRRILAPRNRAPPPPRMFGRSKPIIFNPYGRRRSRWRPSRGLVLLLTGIAIGAAGVVVVQERYLPPRLTAAASQTLRGALEQADADRLRLKGELGAATKRLETALASQQGQTEELAASRASALSLRDDLAALVASLPPDPRGGGVEVRAARFTAQGGQLAYAVVLTRQREAGKPMAGVMQLVVAGRSARGADTTVTLAPVSLSIGGPAIVRGSLPLPAGFTPLRATIQVLDRVGGKPLGMRVMLVQ